MHIINRDVLNTLYHLLPTQQRVGAPSFNILLMAIHLRYRYYLYTIRLSVAVLRIEQIRFGVICMMCFLATLFKMYKPPIKAAFISNLINSTTTEHGASKFITTLLEAESSYKANF